MKNIKTILIAVLSFMLLFSVSCKNEDKTGGGGSGGDYSVPTATGDPATDLTDGNYTGTLNRTAQEGDPDYGNQGTTFNDFTLSIANNSLTVTSLFNTLNKVQILKSGNEYSANGESSVDGGSYKEYIKFTVSGDTITVVEYVMAVSGGAGSVRETYKGTLNKSQN
ncbi:hypothetical protein EPJ67_06040 [Brachyspira aalborgi]|uniref:Lipocalin-like domain-containing protein n=1 Tax=Brachyspira aalborgi TaxID=29522 RepID=A0A5C8G4X9_9SPIR|nr:hypothetical protein [Brachyspira aalborgi]TXJ56935.1 hypothetical protein EPJ67_06040 [Brachyspira aalborgi]